VARYAGGHNAGHTVIINGKKFVLQLVPCGVLRAGCRSVIGNGVVLDPIAFLKEAGALREAGVQIDGHLFVSNRAHVILPYHRMIELAAENAPGRVKIGTTSRGIGPAYEDKVARRAVRVADLFQRDRFAAKLGEVLDFHNFVLQRYFALPPVDFQRTLDEQLEFVERLRPLLLDVTGALARLRAQGANVMFEGAQGAMLDVDVGTYPFVTSSNTTAGGAATGTGLGPCAFDHVLGIVKAYTTRVGAGPFPTELFDDYGEHLSRVGHEFGSVTGRRRRCGWFDAVALRRSIVHSSVSGLCMTKLDVLDGLETIRICVGYRVRGETLPGPPLFADAYADVEPVYEEMPGWQDSTVGVREHGALPLNARRYLERIQELVEVPLDLISTGPDRDQTIVLRHPFDS
jgi:adenylosuccinate synthase